MARLQHEYDPVAAASSAPISGVLLANVVDFSPQGLTAAAAGDESKGIPLGMLTSLPETTVDPDMQNILDNIEDLQGEFVGAQQPGSPSVEMSAEVTKLNRRTIPLFRPGVQEKDWVNNLPADLTVGSGNGEFTVTAIAAGTGGNSISLTLDASVANRTTLSVTVSGNAITVNLVTGTAAAAPYPSSSTAAQIIDAINKHTAANKLVQAGLSLYGGQASNNGSGIVSGAAAANLTGGAAGAKIGVYFDDPGDIKPSNYLRNVTSVSRSATEDIYYVRVVENAVNVAEWNPSFEATSVSGVSVTWRGHITAANRDPVTGAIRRPYREFVVEPAAAV